MEALLKARDEMSAKLKKMQQTAGTETGKLSSHFDKMSKKIGAKMTSIGKKMTLGVTAPIVALGTQAVMSLGRIEKIGAQTDAAIASTGGAANVTREQIDKLAGSLESLTSVEAETITEGQNVLLTFTKIANQVGEGNDIFDRATKATLDMSVALGTDMTSASILVGKALNDPIKGLTALGRSGIQFTEAQKEQIKAMVEAGDTMGAQKIILAELTTQFGGSAEMLGKTMVGRVEKAKHAFGTMTETLATMLLPTVEKVTAAIQKASEWFENLSPPAQKMIGVIIALVATIGPLLIVGGALVKSFAAIKLAWVGLNLAFAITPWGAIITGIVVATALIIMNWDKIVAFLKGVWSWIKRTASGIWDPLLASAKRVFNAIAGFWNNTVGKISFQVPSWVPGIGGTGFDVPDIPTFHEGGVFRAPPGRREGLALLEDGETVSKAGAGPVTHNWYISQPMDATAVFDFAAWRLRTSGV